MGRSLYLQETQFLDIGNADLRQCTYELIAGIDDLREQVKTVFFFVRDKIRYNPYTSFLQPQDYTASTILQRGEGFCIPKASLFTAMMRILKIPAKLYFADIRNHLAPAKLRAVMGDLFIYHCYCGVLLEGQWLKLAPTFNREMCAKINVQTNDFDGFHDALLPLTNLDGELYVEYVKDRGDAADIPFAEIIQAFNDFYGKEVTEKWAQKLVS
jgi:transglutaminase-like putative cysteine protease